jgi:hypothetical protein
VVYQAACGSSHGGSGASATASSTPASVDCTATNPACPEITIQGDAPQSLANGPSPARGYADPSIRRDPATGVLWLAYSWPHLQSVPGATGADTTVVAVDSHLARSDDGGATWSFVRSLWTSGPDRGDAGESGWRNQEVVSLAPATTSSGAVWFSARESYFTRVSAGPKVSSFTIRVAMANSPDKLADAPEAVLGSDLTSPFWNIDLNLDSLSPELKGCIFRDPGIIFRRGSLYMAAECSLFTQTGERTNDEFVAVFSTLPSVDARTWRWTYVGKLATHADAVELGGEMLEQTELTTDKDGSLLAVFSPSKPSSPLATHYGCKVVEVASLEPPALARDSTGKLKVRAGVAATDVGEYGPAACTYEATSKLGLIITRRQLRPGLIVTLNDSGLHP